MIACRRNLLLATVLAAPLLAIQPAAAAQPAAEPAAPAPAEAPQPGAPHGGPGGMMDQGMMDHGPMGGGRHGMMDMMHAQHMHQMRHMHDQHHGAGPGMGRGRDGGMPMMGMPGRDPTKHLEGRIAFLRAEIGITDQQQAAWEKVAQAVRTVAKSAADARPDQQAAQPQPRPDLGQRLASREGRLAAQLDVVRAFRELYAMLTDQQKAAAEELVGPHIGRL